MEETQKQEGGRESTTGVLREEASARALKGPQENPGAAEMEIKQAEHSRADMRGVVRPLE